ncbi:hypothetical protein C8J56DRAFT_1103394 [Mycena floridula]|nr:hypothetical protein C8J56DRAFT_1103394 [Mycena floridula]
MSDQHQGSSGHVQEPTTSSLMETVLNVQQATTPPVSVISEKPHPIFQPDTVGPKPLGSTIPPEHSNRTLILCFDGTGNQFDNKNSNIIRFFSALKKEDNREQMVYYQSGIGTYTSPQIATPFRAKLSKVGTLDMMFACYLDAHVMDGYEFLMQNYIPGDRICLFGFSRGAYTARSLAGMISKVGLLPADNFRQVPFAYKMYTREGIRETDEATAFKTAFSVDVKIEFVGVWDTVESVGLIEKCLPFTHSNNIIRTFRHALSLDERRAKFKANLWRKDQDDEASPLEALVDSLEHMPRSASSLDGRPTAKPSISYNSHWYWKKSLERSPEDESSRSELEKKNSTPLSRDSGKEDRTDVLEVWFPGCHCAPDYGSDNVTDVGGGSVINSTPYSLARISLRWMIRECFKTNTGIMFDTVKLQELGMDPGTLYPSITPRPPALSPGPLLPAQAKRIVEKSRPRDTILSPLVEKFIEESEEKALTEEKEELRDVLSPIYDQLKITKVWWILEILPMGYKSQEGDNKSASWFSPNLACPRRIPRKDGVKFHRSVKTRMDAGLMHDGRPYKPLASHDTEPVWVD